MRVSAGASASQDATIIGNENMKYVIWLMVLALIVAHQDLWYWEDPTLVFGFIPIGLFYHACISLAAGFTWWLACVFAWPTVLAESDTTLDSASENVTKQGGAA
jgi:hypothetical protein